MSRTFLSCQRRELKELNEWARAVLGYCRIRPLGDSPYILHSRFFILTPGLNVTDIQRLFEIGFQVTAIFPENEDTVTVQVQKEEKNVNHRRQS